MSVEKIAYSVPVLDEDIVDYGYGTPEQQDAAGARIEARRAESKRLWMARHIWERAWFRLRYNRRWYEARHRIAHAARAVRGIDCERY